MPPILITGGAGFIGSNFVRYWCQKHPDAPVVVLDALTYAGNRATLADLEQQGKLTFVQGNICDRPLVDRLLRDHDIEIVAPFRR